MVLDCFEGSSEGLFVHSIESERKFLVKSDWLLLAAENFTYRSVKLKLKGKFD